MGSFCGPTTATIIGRRNFDNRNRTGCIKAGRPTCASDQAAIKQASRRPMQTLEVTSPIPAVGTSIPDTKAEPGGPHHAARFQSPTPPQIPANPRKSPQIPANPRKSPQIPANTDRPASVCPPWLTRRSLVFTAPMQRRRWRALLCPSAPCASAANNRSAAPATASVHSPLDTAGGRQTPGSSIFIGSTTALRG